MTQRIKYLLWGAAIVFLSYILLLNREPEDLNFLFFDDSFYYLDIATTGNFFNVTADNISKTNGFHPLWLWSLMLLSALTGVVSLDLAIIGSGVFTLLSFLVWFNVFEKLKCTLNQAFWFTIGLTFFPVSFLIGISGMEMPAVLLTFGLVLNSIFSLPKSLEKTKETATEISNKLFMLGVCFGLLFLARTDMAIYILGFTYYLVWKYKDQWRSLKPTYVVFGIMVGLYLLYNLFTAGVFLQSSGGVYPTVRWNEVFEDTSFVKGYLIKAVGAVTYSLTLIGYWLGSLLVLLPVLTIGLSHAWGAPKSKFIITLFISSVAYFAFHNLGRLTYNIWYIQTFYIFVVILMAYIYVRGWKKTVLASTIISVLLVLGGLFCYTDCQGYLKTENKVFKYWSNHKRPLDQLAGSQALREIGYTGKFGAFNSGEFGFYNKDVVNLDGLSNSTVLKAYNKGEGIKYLRDNNIHTIIDVSFYFTIFNRWVPLDSFIYAGDIQYPYEPRDGSTTACFVLKGTPLADEIIKRASKK